MRKSDNAVNEGGDWRILCNVTVDNVFYELPNLFFPLVHFPIAPHLPGRSSQYSCASFGDVSGCM